MRSYTRKVVQRTISIKLADIQNMLTINYSLSIPIFNIHFNGLPFDKFPFEAYPNGDYPLVPVATRDTFERLLRQLILGKGGRIRWLIGTVTGIQSFNDRQDQLKSVSVRIKETNEDLIIDASLVIGMRMLLKLIGDNLHL